MSTVDDQRREWYKIPLWSSFLSQCRTNRRIGREFGRSRIPAIETACSLWFLSDDFYRAMQSECLSMESYAK